MEANKNRKAVIIILSIILIIETAILALSLAVNIQLITGGLYDHDNYEYNNSIEEDTIQRVLN